MCAFVKKKNNITRTTLEGLEECTGALIIMHFKEQRTFSSFHGDANEVTWLVYMSYRLSGPKQTLLVTLSRVGGTNNMPPTARTLVRD